MKHDPHSIVKELSEKLGTRGRHVVFLIGAGGSCAAGLPSLEGLQKSVLAKLSGEERKRYEELSKGRNIEQVLTRLRLIAEAVRESTQKVDGITSAEAQALDKAVCGIIAEIMTKTNVDLSHHEKLAVWIGLNQYDRPVELFTTNYDLLLEKGLEASKTPYFDGFIGVFGGHFRSDLVDEDIAHPDARPPKRWVRLWKLHGSVSWVQEVKGGVTDIVRVGMDGAVPPAAVLAIYPSMQKYEESRRMPFVALADRLRRSLALPETLVLTCGYSFGDQHINELLFDSARFYARSEVVTLFRNDIPKEVAAQAKQLPNLCALGGTKAIVGGEEAEWGPSSEITSYWREGKFRLGDFGVLSAFLGSKAARDSAHAVEEKKS